MPSRWSLRFKITQGREPTWIYYIHRSHICIRSTFRFDYIIFSRGQKYSLQHCTDIIFLPEWFSGGSFVPLYTGLHVYAYIIPVPNRFLQTLSMYVLFLKHHWEHSDQANTLNVSHQHSPTLPSTEFSTWISLITPWTHAMLLLFHWCTAIPQWFAPALRWINLSELVIN